MGAVQLITLNQQIQERFSGINGLEICGLQDFRDLDSFSLNIFDMSSPGLWENDTDSTRGINSKALLAQFKPLIQLSKGTNIVIALPQNQMFYSGFSFADFAGTKQFVHQTELKDMIPDLHRILVEVLYTIQHRIVYAPARLEVENQFLSADFALSQASQPIGEELLNFNEEQAAVVRYPDGVVLTTLDVLESPPTLQAFLVFLEKENAENVALPNWLDEVDVLNDKELRAEQIRIENEIKLLRNQLAAVQREQKNNTQLKTLLISSGDTLSKQAGRMLAEMAGSDAIINQAERRISCAQCSLIWSAQSSKGEAKPQFISELFNQVMQEEGRLSDQGLEENVKGLLVLNDHYDTLISERPPLAQRIIDIAERNQILVLPASSLLILYNSYLTKAKSSEEIMTRLGSESGLWKD
ncbi:MAG: hypothetical protein LBR25_08715 [Erysipelotrichaceae bacterium]|jgi:hypothetical protein|nr:hypothetical protein [Erysipelotrichaceae bacterium]